MLTGPSANTLLSPGIVAGSCTDVVGKASCFGSLSADTGDVVDFQKVNGNLKRDAGRGSPFYRTDASLKKSFRIPRAESVRLELQADVLNLFNHSNWQGFNANDILSVLGLGSTS